MQFDDELAALLAEVTATPPPADLRAQVLAAARDRRAPGRPLGVVDPCPPAEAFTRTIDDLYALLQTLTADEWPQPAHEEHGRVRDLIGHLIGLERLSLRWLDPADDMPLVPDHVAATRAVVAELAAVDGPELAARWQVAARAVAAAAAHGDPDRAVAFHDLRTDVAGFLITRTFELWAHSMDISLATGRPLLELDHQRMRALSSRLMGAVPAALAYRGKAAPQRTVRFVLTGPAGGCYDVPLRMGAEPSEPDAAVITDPVALCRLAARRLRPSELPGAIEGDAALAELVLADLDAFARD